MLFKREVFLKKWVDDLTLCDVILCKTKQAYPTVVIVTNAHQNPCHTPVKKWGGKSSAFELRS